jgi:hypothetical protein
MVKFGHELSDVEWLWVKKKPITTRNPQANAIVERIHQTIGNIIPNFQKKTTWMRMILGKES